MAFLSHQRKPHLFFSEHHALLQLSQTPDKIKIVKKMATITDLSSKNNGQERREVSRCALHQDSQDLHVM